MKRKSLLFISMMLILSIFLAACGGGNDTGKKDGENVAQDLRININTEPPTLHPGLARIQHQEQCFVKCSKDFLELT